MTTHVRVSPVVDAALAAAGFRPLAPGEDGALVAVALDGSDLRVELHVLRADDTTRARVAALRSVRHEHLARVLEAVPLGPDVLGVFTDHVRGIPLAGLCAPGDVLTEGEAATVAIPVAQALDALHAAGAQHGGVGDRTIVVGPDGRPVLAGLGAALRHVPAAHDESGADVRALLDAVLARLEPSATGLGSLAEALEELRGEPVPSAARVVDRCFRVAVPEPVRLPHDCAPGRVGRTALTSHREDGALPDGVPAGQPRPSRRDLGTRGPHRTALRTSGRRAVGVLAAVGAAVLVAGIAGAIVVAPWRASADGGPAAAPSRASATPGPAGQAARTDARDAAVMLTQRRAALLAAGSGAALHEVEVPGSPAHEADSRLVAQLGQDRVVGLEVTVTGVERLPPDVPDEERVRVTSTTTPYERIGPDGARRPGGGAATSTVVLVLRWTESGWRVWDVMAA